ncbi:MAG: 50S ribosomal protein L25/general stress protein Ctc [Gammaproteobacteria bacterium]|jgi:large subunit ribosomal protein L25|nr:50S ribosomal protein L25/general stress protein Ctc [Gammaproteobacteria bacterium]
MSSELNATLRGDKGKGASRRLRHANTFPAIVYGGGKDPVSITLQQKDVQHKLPDETFYSQVLSLNIEGKVEDVLLRDIQHHPYKMNVMHMDFIRVDANKVVHVFSQLHFSGEDVSPGVKTEDGVANHVITEVEVVCLPKDIPEFIAVDLSEMQVGDVVHLSDLKLPEGVEILALKQGEEHDTAVVGMHVRKVVAEVEEGAPETPDAPESETGSSDEEGDDGE